VDANFGGVKQNICNDNGCQHESGDIFFLQLIKIFIITVVSHCNKENF